MRQRIVWTLSSAVLVVAFQNCGGFKNASDSQSSLSLPTSSPPGGPSPTPFVSPTPTPVVSPTPSPTPGSAGCPYSAPLTTPGVYTLNVLGLFADAANGNQVDQSSIANAIACAQVALGNSLHGNQVTVNVELPAGVIDLSHALTNSAGKPLKGSIDVSGINCVSPTQANCGNVAGQPANTSNQLVIKGAGADATTLIFAMDSNNHANDLTGIYGRNSVNVTFRGLKWTWPYMMVTQGTVVSSTTSAVVVDIAAGFPSPDALLDLVNFPNDGVHGGGRFLRVFNYAPGSGGVTNCSIAQDPINPDGSIAFSQIPWGTGTTAPLGLQQISQNPNRWMIPFGKSTSVAPYTGGQIIGVKSKQGQNVYGFFNDAFITFDSIAMERRSRGVFGGATIGGTTYGSLNVTVTNSSILPELPIQRISPCMSTPDGGPQFGGQLGIPSSGHVVNGNTFISVGDDPIAFFDVTNSQATGNTVTDSYSGRAILAAFSNMPAAPLQNGGEGYNLCQPRNTLARDIIYLCAPGINSAGCQQILCP